MQTIILLAVIAPTCIWCYRFNKRFIRQVKERQALRVEVNCAARRQTRTGS